MQTTTKPNTHDDNAPPAAARPSLPLSQEERRIAELTLRLEEAEARGDALACAVGRLNAEMQRRMEGAHAAACILQRTDSYEVRVVRSAMALQAYLREHVVVRPPPQEEEEEGVAHGALCVRLNTLLAERFCFYYDGASASAALPPPRFSTPAQIHNAALQLGVEGLTFHVASQRWRFDAERVAASLR